MKKEDLEDDDDEGDQEEEEDIWLLFKREDVFIPFCCVSTFPLLYFTCFLLLFQFAICEFRSLFATKNIPATLSSVVSFPDFLVLQLSERSTRTEEDDDVVPDASLLRSNFSSSGCKLQQQQQQTSCWCWGHSPSSKAVFSLYFIKFNQTLLLWWQNLGSNIIAQF